MGEYYAQRAGAGLPIAAGVFEDFGAEIAWPRPVRSGVVLRVESEILELKPSKAESHLTDRPSLAFDSRRIRRLHGWVAQGRSTFSRSYCLLARSNKVELRNLHRSATPSRAPESAKLLAEPVRPKRATHRSKVRGFACRSCARVSSILRIYARPPGL
jgi:hypothetical protein